MNPVTRAFFEDQAEDHQPGGDDGRVPVADERCRVTRIQRMSLQLHEMQQRVIPNDIGYDRLYRCDREIMSSCYKQDPVQIFVKRTCHRRYPAERQKNKRKA